MSATGPTAAVATQIRSIAVVSHDRGTSAAVVIQQRPVAMAGLAQGPAVPPGRDAVGEAYAFPVTITAPGQTVIPLPVPPTRLSSVTLTINGLAYRAPNLGVSEVAVTWLNPAFRLDPQDDVVLTYA